MAKLNLGRDSISGDKGQCIANLQKTDNKHRMVEITEIAKSELRFSLFYLKNIVSVVAFFSSH